MSVAHRILVPYCYLADLLTKRLIRLMTLNTLPLSMLRDGRLAGGLEDGTIDIHNTFTVLNFVTTKVSQASQRAAHYSSDSTELGFHFRPTEQTTAPTRDNECLSIVSASRWPSGSGDLRTGSYSCETWLFWAVPSIRGRLLSSVDQIWIQLTTTESFLPFSYHQVKIPDHYLWKFLLHVSKSQ